MKAQPWRLFGRPAAQSPEAAETAEPSDTVGLPSGRTGRVSTVAARLIAVEPWLAPVCALILLLAPNPLLWPAAILGALPSVARVVTTGRPWRATPFDVPLALLAVGAGLGGWASLSRDGALIRLTGLLAALVLFAAVREHASSTRALQRLIPGLLIAAVVSAAPLLVLVGPFLLLDHVPGVAALVSAVDRWRLGAWFVDQDWLLQRYRFRASGVGALGVIGVALAFAMFVGRGGWLMRLATIMTIPLFLVLLVVADNRGAMLAGALTVGAMATVWRRRLLPLIPVAGLLGVLFLAFGPVDRGLSLKTLAQRFWFWENSLYLAREAPFTGAGLGLESVQLVYRAYFLPAYPPFSHAHNIYLQGLLEYGVFGLLGLLGLGLATLYVGWRAPAASDRLTMAGRLAGFGVGATMLTTGLSEIVMLTTFGSALALGALGLLAATSDRPRASVARIPKPRRASDSGRWLRVAFPAAAVLVVVMVMAVTPFGSRMVARILLNAGTADLNRGALSESLDKKGREAALERATGSLQLAASFDADDVAIQRNLALALTAVNDSRPARAAADRAKALTAPGNRADQAQLGRMYTAMNSWGEAIRAYQAAEAAPQLLQLANRLLRLRNYDQAINAFIATARVDPTSRGAYDGATRAVRDRKGSTDDVIEALRPLLDPSSKTEYGARLQAAQVYREAGRLRDATEQLVRAEQISGGPELSFENARVMMAAGRPDLAEPLLRKPVEDQPFEPEGWLWLARAQAMLGLHDQAVATIRQGLSKVDTSGQFAPAAEKLPETAAVRAVEIKRSERAPLLGVMAESLIRLGRASEALPVLDEAVAAAPKDGWLATVRSEAQAAADGGPLNVALNSAFDHDGAWALRTEAWWLRPSVTAMLNETPRITDGGARLEQSVDGQRLLVQEILELEPGRRYRLSARVRGEGLGAGSIRVSLVSLRTSREVARSVEPADAARWVMVPVEAPAGHGQDNNLTIVIGFGPNTPPGAVLQVDDVTLIPADGPRAANAPRRPGG